MTTRSSVGSTIKTSTRPPMGVPGGSLILVETHVNLPERLVPCRKADREIKMLSGSVQLTPDSA